MEVNLRKYIIQFFVAFIALMLGVFIVVSVFGIIPPAVTSIIALIACCAGTAQNFIKTEGRGLTKPERIKFSTLCAGIYTIISFLMLCALYYFVIADLNADELKNAIGLETLPSALEWIIALPLALGFAFGLTWTTLYFTVSLFGRNKS